MTRARFSSHHCFANSLLNMRLLNRTRFKSVRGPSVASVMKTPFSTSSTHSRGGPMAVNSRGDACDVVCVVRVVCAVLFLVARSAMASRVARSRTASSSARREICVSASSAIRRARSMNDSVGSEGSGGGGVGFGFGGSSGTDGFDGSTGTDGFGDDGVGFGVDVSFAKSNVFVAVAARVSDAGARSSRATRSSEDPLFALPIDVFATPSNVGLNTVMSLRVIFSVVLFECAAGPVPALVPVPLLSRIALYDDVDPVST